MKARKAEKVYIVVDALDHDQTRYEPGDEVVLADAQAELLMLLKVVVPKPLPVATEEVASE